MHKITDGLHLQLKSLNEKLDNSTFLKRDADNISLTCVFSGFECSVPFGRAHHSYEITFLFQYHFFNHFAEGDKDFSIQQFPKHQHHDLCCNTHMILHDIINCKLTGTFRNMFLESKALALLLCFQKCNASMLPECESCKFLTKPIKKEKIIKARQILLSNLENPPTIPQLAREVGINQCYLKKGFKEIFNATIYNFVQEQRMLKAKLLLTTTSFTVSEVAEKIGFSSSSNFSSAFRRFTGISPKKLSQNLKIPPGISDTAQLRA